MLLLREHHKIYDLIEVGNKEYFAICPQTESPDVCYEYYTTKKNRYPESTTFSMMLCKNCRSGHAGKENLSKLSQEEKDLRISHTSRVPFTKLRSNELVQRLRNISNKKQSLIMQLFLATHQQSLPTHYNLPAILQIRHRRYPRSFEDYGFRG